MKRCPHCHKRLTPSYAEFRDGGVRYQARRDAEAVARLKSRQRIKATGAAVFVFGVHRDGIFDMLEKMFQRNARPPVGLAKPAHIGIARKFAHVVCADSYGFAVLRETWETYGVARARAASGKFDRQAQWVSKFASLEDTLRAAELTGEMVDPGLFDDIGRRGTLEPAPPPEQIAALRKAVQAAHPDKGGTPEAFHKAMKALDAARGTP